MGVPEVLLDVDADAPVWTSEMQKLKELARLVGARTTESPLCVD